VIVDARAAARLRYLARIVEREMQRLETTDRRLFVQDFTAERACTLAADEDLAERVEAFVARFGRLQDTIGDKLLPAYLAAHGERIGTFADNLDRAERLGIIEDAQAWIDMRKLRNQMVHEYVEDPVVLASAIGAAHGFVPNLVFVARHLVAIQP
jgi:hypothetical protein